MEVEGVWVSNDGQEEGAPEQFAGLHSSTGPTQTRLTLWDS